MEWQNGIDTIVHETTLEYNGNTIAVLGNGFNEIFPKENIELYKKIIEKSGLIISEYDLNIKAKSEYFIERNRIVSGISDGVLIIESAYRSGTSITARLAKEQGKKVFALPHDINDKHGTGNNILIKENKAILVRTTEEIIENMPDIVFQKTNINKIQKKDKISKTKKR